MRYLSSTFSPMMLDRETMAVVSPIAIGRIPRDAKSIVGHEVTAKILSVLLGREVQFNRESVSLGDGDTLFCVIPNFRAQEAREFSREEIEEAGWRTFVVQVYDWP